MVLLDRYEYHFELYNTLLFESRYELRYKMEKMYCTELAYISAFLTKLISILFTLCIEFV